MTDISVLTVANAFLELAWKSGKKLTNMQLQKLAYIAHGFTLAILDKPLFEEEIRAFPWGPVIPDLYEELRGYGRTPVTKRLEAPEGELGDKERRIVDAVFAKYGGMSGFGLSDLTHYGGTPWDITWEREKFSVIDPKLISAYYKNFLAEAA